MARPNFEQEWLAFLRHGRQRVGKSNRAPTVPRPVLGIGCLRRFDPTARDARRKGHLGRRQRHGGRSALDVRKRGVERARMEGMRDSEKPTGDAALGEAVVQGVDLFARARRDAE